MSRGCSAGSWQTQDALVLDGEPEPRIHAPAALLNRIAHSREAAADLSEHELVGCGSDIEAAVSPSHSAGTHLLLQCPAFPSEAATARSLRPTAAITDVSARSADTTVCSGWVDGS